MTDTEKLIQKLRETPSRSKRQFLDNAADTIEALLTDFLSALSNRNAMHCDFCTHRKISDFVNRCSKDTCKQYIEGVGDTEGKFPNWHWHCRDFNFGDCPRLENTPCHGCIQSNCKNFKWRGVQKNEN